VSEKVMSKRGKRQEVPADGHDLSARAAHNTIAANPLLGIRAADLQLAARAMLKGAATQPKLFVKHLAGYAAELVGVARGRSAIAADQKDKRFADPAWQGNAMYRRLLQAYLSTGQRVDKYITAMGLSAVEKERARFLASLVVDGSAPCNTVLGNPAALKKMVDTGGMSLVHGLKNLLHDVRHNGMLPSQVDAAAFELGRNVAATPGAVVFRNEVLELIQYAPTTAKVSQRPLIVCPPQINKFYAIDLSPEKSLVRWILDSEVQLFAVSWRNPTRKQRDWNLDTYVAALDEAVDAARQITGSPDVNLWGNCSGGITMASYLGWLAAIGERKVASAVAAVCVLDMSATQSTTVGLFTTPKTVKAAKLASRERGVVDGQEMARMFAWLRPNDLIWNYWVNNYLLGNKPPAFDILFWNSDTTRLPAGLHADYLDLIDTNPFVNAEAMTVCGAPIDMRQVKVEAYVVGGTTDHITPWQGCLATARIYGGDTTFVLANSGHLQSLINPPTNPKACFMTAKAGDATPEAWAAQAPRHEGSWWLHWRAWIGKRSGRKVVAPARLGSRKHRPGEPAPGAYVKEH
jgi:polyhydroxyalkanoate synthase